ncbi:MAG: UDP-glucose 4-epimerase GalE [Pseudomonadota bacterium]
MTILVTGGAGYIGSHVVLDLLDAGYDVHILDTLETGHRHLVDPRATLHIGSIHDMDVVSDIMQTCKIETIFHFAAYIQVAESVDAPEKYYHNNTAGVLSLLRAAVQYGLKKVIFSSTAAVYGAAEGATISEATPLAPINPYGASKMMAERIVQDMAAAHGFDFIILRYFNVAGADRTQRSGQITEKATHLIKAACETALGKRPSLSVFGTDYPTPDGTGVRDYIHVSDLAAAHLAVLKTAPNQIFNCGYGTGFSVKDVLQTVEKVSETKLQTIYAPRRVGDAPCVIADASRLKRCTDWTPRYNNLEDIIRDALSWERSPLNKPYSPES